MFIKPFRTKSNVQLKGSDRKKLQSKIALKFTVTDDDLNMLFPNKGSVFVLKINTHSDEIITVYAVDKRPLFFETAENILLPTVYALWLIPNLIPLFTTHPDVLPRLAKGANLMLPGVIRQGKGNRAYGFHKKDEVVAVNLTSNKAAVGVGLLARSSDDLYMCGGVGVCVNMIHVFGDKLWGMDANQCLQIPFLGAAMEMPKEGDFPALGDNQRKVVEPAPIPVKCNKTVEHFPALGTDPKRKPPKPTTEDVCEMIDQVGEITLVAEDDQDNDVVETETPPESPTPPLATEDGILRIAFLTALKRDGKQMVLPMLTSTFYRCHVVPAADRPIELKKTSYKKLSKFLSEMAQNRFLTVKEELKGIEKIIEINLLHPDLVEFVPKIQTNVEGQNGGLILAMVTA